MRSSTWVYTWCFPLAAAFLTILAAQRSANGAQPAAGEAPDRLSCDLGHPLKNGYLTRRD